MLKNLLITGKPRSGKSTLLNKILSTFNDKIGFVTNEVRENGERIGFDIVTHNGTKTRLADVKFNSPYKVSRYYVKPETLDSVVSEVETFGNKDLLYLDEIGQMQLFSERFKKLALAYFDSPNTVIATVSKVYTDSFTEEIKKRPDAYLVEITESNRDGSLEKILMLIKKINKAKVYSKEPDRFKLKQLEVEMKSEHDARQIYFENDEWKCSCGFYEKNKICSHIIALKEIIKIK